MLPVAMPGFPRLGMRTTRRLGNLVAYVCILGFLALVLLPLFWTASTSLKTPDQVRSTVPIRWIPTPLYPENYRVGWAAQPWLKYLGNTLRWAVGTSIGLLISVTLPAYAFARMKFRGREALMFLNIILMLLPYQVTMIPVFMLNSKLGWVGSWNPVMVPCFLAAAPHLVFMLRQFFRTIPMELSEAARIDGCNELSIIWHIILPLTKPALAIIVVGNFQWAWSDLLTSLIYFRDPAHMTLVLGMQTFIDETTHGTTVLWGPLMAMSVVWALPMVVLFYFSQRYFVKTFTLVGITG